MGQPPQIQHPATTKGLVRRCPVCGCPSGEVLRTQRFALATDHPLPHSYDVVTCIGCAFTFADTSGSQDAYERYYANGSKYADPSIATGGGDTPRDRLRLERTATDLARLVGNRDGSLLDVGCGSGGLLAALRSRGFADLHGLDPSLECIRRLQSSGIAGIHGGIFSWDWGRAFDIVTLTHVLEHVRDLPGAMTRIRDGVRPGGLVFAEVPDASRYEEHWVVPYYYFDIEHINHFDGLALSALFACHGFATEALGITSIDVAPGRTYPAVHGCFRRHDGTPERRHCGFGATTGVRGHLRQSQTAVPNAELEELATTGVPVALWGAGNHALRLIGSSALGRCNIVAVVDKDTMKHASYLANVPILPPASLLDWKGPIIVCSALFTAEISAEIRAMGLENRLVTVADGTPR